ncbi:hypothetical protein [Salarchaeum sp. JOR-1]|uniref:hypothetical protein n=1 Tax=Salarchaeum sp. JOR-1 TaxID=2599399 RepID=UPI0011983D8A|nr:hypothetical protein [Salarchaeum sp. JOR-1]QDX40734.1 hypothetical protein FQU85_07360 [Salarchaeum sp. JOR-1]
MNWSLFAKVVGVYGVLAAGATAAVLFAVASFAGVALPWVSIGLVLGGGVLVAFSLGRTDVGVDTASTAAETGFGGGNPTQYRPDALPIASRVVFAVYFAGLVAWGAATFPLVT